MACEIDMRRFYKFLATVMIALACAFVGVSASNAETSAADVIALEQTVDAMCSKSVVILGEASHGDGHTDAVKSELIQRLVSQCGFNGVLFESSFYEFVPIARNVRERKPVTAKLVADAVGGFWKFDREVQPLLEFLSVQVGFGKVQLGGLDLQAGGFEQPYSNEVMFSELMSRLPTERHDFCKALYRARVFGNAPPDQMSEVSVTNALKACLSDVDVASRFAESPNSHLTDQRLQLINLRAWLAMQEHSQRQKVQERDRMMAENAIRFIESLPKPAKVVVWAHNGHAARETSALDDYDKSDNMGSVLSRRYGDALFSLATTSCGGEYRWSFGSNKVIPTAPQDSLEAKYCQGSAIVSTFVHAAELKQLSVLPAGMFGHTFRRANWGNSFDGVLVLDKEYPPHNTRQ